MTKHEDEELEFEDELEDDDDDEDAVLEEDSVNGRGAAAGFAMGLILGAILGAGAALLLAPQRGDLTRRRIRRQFRDLRDEAAGHVGEWRDEARRELRRQRKRLRRRRSN